MICILVCVALSEGGRAAWVDVVTIQTRWQIAQWREGKGPPVTPELWIRARDQLIYGTRITPQNAQLFEDLGYLYASRAEAFGEQDPRTAIGRHQINLFNDAVNSFRASVKLRPTYPYAWAHFALAKQRKGEVDSEYLHAFDQAYRFGNSEAGVQIALARMAFGRWATLDSERRDRVRAMIDAATPALKKTILGLATVAKVKI